GDRLSLHLPGFGRGQLYLRSDARDRRWYCTAPRVALFSARSPLTRLGGTILAHQKLGARLRAPAILVLAKIEGSDCEWMQHVPTATSVGVRPAQADAITQQSVVRGEDAGTFLRNQTGEFGHPE